jgi:hypothetical protein
MSLVASAVALRGQRITGSPHLVRPPGSPFAKLGPALERLYKARGAAQDAGFQRESTLVRIRQDPVLIDAVASSGAEALRSEMGICAADPLPAAACLVLGTDTLDATSTATLGPNLIVNGADIAVNAPEVSILAGTSISV